LCRLVARLTLGGSLALGRAVYHGWNFEERPRLDCGPFRPRENIGIISARKTTLREQKDYKEEKNGGSMIFTG
jgi:hypothetical protein